MLSINERIQRIVNEMYGGNVSDFERISQIKPSTIKNVIGGRKTKPSFDILESIIRNNALISSEWLLTGKGDMLKRFYPGETLEVNDYMESVVCHYTKMENFLVILKSLSLYGSSFEKSNDYKERRSIEEMIFNGRPYNPNLRYISFCSGSLGCKNPVLWYHYAKAHTGVCIGVDIENLGGGIQGGNIIYERNINNDTYSQDIYMMRKAPEWMGEIEYRLLFDSTKKDAFYFTDRLKFICFGVEVNDEIVNQVKNIIPKGVPLYRIGIDSNGHMVRCQLFTQNGECLEGQRDVKEPLYEECILGIAKKIGLEKEVFRLLNRNEGNKDMTVSGNDNSNKLEGKDRDMHTMYKASLRQILLRDDKIRDLEIELELANTRCEELKKEVLALKRMAKSS